MLYISEMASNPREIQLAQYNWNYTCKQQMECEIIWWSERKLQKMKIKQKKYASATQLNICLTYFLKMSLKFTSSS